jgi:MFS transporter, PPP family, 3-phenylpropionic acid transporter
VRISGPIAYIVLYSAMYGAFGVASPFWPKIFEAKALTSLQIGVVLGTAMLARLVAGPLVGMLADLSGSLRLTLATCAGSAAAMAAALSSANVFWMLLFLALIQAAALAPMTSIADGLSVSAAKPRLAGKPFEYGWIRGAASAAFVSGTLIIGQLIRRDDLSPIIWMNVALLVATAAATALVPAAGVRAQTSRSLRGLMVEVHGLIGIASFRNVIIVSALVYGSHAMHDAFAVIRWSDAGMDAPAISLLWSEAVAAEVIVFVLIGPALLNRLGALGAAALAAAAGVIRWCVAGVTTSVLLLSFVQPLHGLTFALLHLACMRMIGSLVPATLSATAQTFYAFGSGFTTAVLTLFSGWLYSQYGGYAFFAMAILCGFALPVAWFGLAGEHIGSRKVL